MQRLEKRIPLATPTVHGDEMPAIQEAFDRNWVAPLGFHVDAFEEEMAAYLGRPLHALALSSGTAALHLAVKLAGLKRGEKVFCSDMTFAATVNPVSYEGGEQVFIDSEWDTWNMDPRALEKAFEKYPDTRVVMMAHLYGTPGKMEEILSVCRRHNAILIEDAAESLSATYQGRQTGVFGEYGVISFNGNKIITTSGGGMLLCRKREDREKAFFWATQAREKALWYQHEEIGYNYRLSNVLAGIGRRQLTHLEEHRAAKERIYRRYEEAFRGLPLSMNPYEKEKAQPNFWLSCALLDGDCGLSPLAILEGLNDLNIEGRPIWKPMHMQPVFRGHDFISAEDTPVNEQIFARGLCLPSDIKMTEWEQDQVIAAIRAMF